MISSELRAFSAAGEPDRVGVLRLYAVLIRDVREERRVSKVLMRRIVDSAVRVAICMYAARSAGESVGGCCCPFGRLGF